MTKGLKRGLNLIYKELNTSRELLSAKLIKDKTNESKYPNLSNTGIKYYFNLISLFIKDSSKNQQYNTTKI